MFYLILIFSFILSYIFLKRFSKTKASFKKANILIIGGTSGLGLNLAQILQSHGANITIAARSNKMNTLSFTFLQLDITDISTFKEINTNYDYIFCCAGSSLPGYFYKINLNVYKQQMELNYYGTLNVLSHYFKNNKKPFSFVMICSTIAYFTFSGYSAYAPSKSALKSFYDSAYLELKKHNVELYIYYLSSVETPSFDAENAIKPDFTKQIEGMSGMSPKNAASMLINQMINCRSNEICSDNMTKIFKTKCEIYSVEDIFYMLLSLVVYPIARMYVKYKFRNVKLE